MKKTLIVLAVVAAGGFGLMYFGDDHQRFLEFDQQRDAWHRRCDAYIDAAKSPKAVACAEELAEMMAYAKRQGWAE